MKGTSFILYSNLNKSQHAADRAHKNDQHKQRAQILYHEAKHLLSAERMSSELNFLLYKGNAHIPDHKQAGEKSCYWHHDGVGQKVKEIQELHSKDGNTAKRSIAEG